VIDEHVPFKDSVPFYRRNLEEGKRDIFSVSVNESRRAKLEDLKGWLDCPQDSTMVNLAIDIVHNVLRSTFGDENLRYLFSKRRVRRGN
jgi:hypothetical protein